MAASLILKTFDTYPPVVATLTDSNGAINLTTATSVKFCMKGNTMGSVILGTCSIVTPASGIVQYAWALNDTQQADTYQVEFLITWPGGPPTQYQKVPNATALNPTIEIDSSLDTSAG